jgi:hypothetical protein
MNTSARRLSRNVIHPVVLALGAALLLAGCASTRDARSRGNIASLKTAHLAFIDEFTEGAGKTWDDQKLTTSAAATEKKFSDAEQYEATKKKDTLRGKAIANLHSQFKKNVKSLESGKAFYRPKFAAHLKDQISENYDQALRGEDVR